MPTPYSSINSHLWNSSSFSTSEYLQVFECYLNDLLDKLDNNVSDLAKQVVLNGGKRIRPVLVFLCGSRNSEFAENLLKASSVIELVHVATLVHDDILDNASIRRGNPTLHSLHSKHTSILLGDSRYKFVIFKTNTI